MVKAGQNSPFSWLCGKLLTPALVSMVSAPMLMLVLGDAGGERSGVRLSAVQHVNQHANRRKKSMGFPTYPSPKVESSPSVF